MKPAAPESTTPAIIFLNGNPSSRQIRLAQPATEDTAIMTSMVKLDNDSIRFDAEVSAFCPRSKALTATLFNRLKGLTVR